MQQPSRGNQAASSSFVAQGWQMGESKKGKTCCKVAISHDILPNVGFCYYYHTTSLRALIGHRLLAGGPSGRVTHTDVYMMHVSMMHLSMMHVPMILIDEFMMHDACIYDACIHDGCTHDTIIQDAYLYDAYSYDP